MKLYLFRHAAVEEAYRGRYNGHIDISASKEGLKEARENFKPLKKIAFDAVFCSTLKRAKETLAYFELDQEIIFSDAIREKSWGRHEGRSYDEVVAMEGKNYENFSQWLELLDGEETQVFISRVKDFLEELKALEHENVLLVTHAGVIHTLIHLLQACSLEAAFGVKIAYGTHYLLVS